MDCISVILARKGQAFCATVHFNLIKCSATVTDHNLGVFCQKLAEELRSTTQKVSPLPGRSSSGTSRFDPSSVSVTYDDAHPLDVITRAQIQLVISRFIDEKVEFAKLLAEAMRPDV